MPFRRKRTICTSITSRLFKGADFVKPEVRLEFGARSTGEPRERRSISCEAASEIPEIKFPVAHPMVMRPERTFWEKATAVHVFCLRTSGGSDRLSRHWYDLVRLDESEFGAQALDDKQVARQVAMLKNTFYRTNDDEGQWIDFQAVVSGSLRLVPEGERRESVAEDYGNMKSSGMLPQDAESFDDLMTKCKDIEQHLNHLAGEA